MSQLNLYVSRSARKTGRILHNVLREGGMDVRCVFRERSGNGISPAELTGIPTICYGTYIKGASAGMSRVLNGSSARLSKMDQASRLEAILGGGALAVYHGTPHLRTSSFPLLGRRRYHRGGTDIVPILGPSDLAARLSGSQSDFLTEYVDTVKEYRVWVYRGRHLGSYEKYLSRPERYTGIGRNYDNGWAFRLVPSESIDRQVTAVAGIAVDALGLDFGGVDVGVRPDGSPVVFEVNRAPGVEGGTRQVIRALGRKIANWLNAGCPKRSEAAQSFDGRDLESAFSEAFAS